MMKLVNLITQQKQKKLLKIEKLYCGAEWTRTTDTRIFSPMLYQLSYSTAVRDGKNRNF